MSFYARLRLIEILVAGSSFPLLLITPQPLRSSHGSLGVLMTIRKPQSCAAIIAAVLLLALATPSFANNYGESLGWQFRTSADRVNQAAILDVIEKRRAGYYAAPTYTTTIQRQYNCTIASTATGNSGAQTALSNSPTVNGATSTATGNSSSTSSGLGGSADSQQGNSGAVRSGVIGSTSASVRGSAQQALNSTQTNSGNQSAGVDASTACTFGALN